jgi:hypothetical protein
MNNGGAVPGPNEPSQRFTPDSGGTFELHVALDGMDPEDGLRIQLPLPAAGSSLSDFLDQVFPEDEEQQQQVTSLLDVRANPDLPDIYETILDAFDEWRSGRSTLSFRNDTNQPLDLADPVTNHLQPNAETPPFRKGGLGGFPPFRLHIHRDYQPLEYAIQQDFWDTKAELLEWLQTHTLLYFMDKHELRLQASPPGGVDHALLPIAQLLQAQELIALSQETNTFAITREGRRFIGRLLAETESYIDLYDHFKDTAFEADADVVEFDTGHGADLRVMVFIAEGLDPIRTLFLLRLYDGTLDAFASTWQEFIGDESFFAGILEPVVNRQDVEEPLLERIVGAGFAYLEEKHEEARASASREEIIQSARAES